MPSGAEYIIDVLIHVGVKRIYGIAGDSLNAFTEVLRTNKKIDWISVRHEEVAAFAAGAEAQLSGSLTVCMGSCGPGNTHLINGLYDCHRSNAPVLAIAAQIPTLEIGSDYFQETHPESLFQECSQYCQFVSQAEQIPRLIQIAIQRALALKDVSVLIIPGDVAWTKVATKEKPKFHIPDPIHLHSSTDNNIDPIAKVLNESNKVTILAGIGCKDAREEVIKVAEVLKTPIVSTLRSKDILSFDNPYYVGLTGLLGISSGYEALNDCDTLLMLGTDFPYRQFYPTDAKIIQIDIRGENIGRRANVDYAVVGDVRYVLTDLLERLDFKNKSQFLEKAQQNYIQAQKELNDCAVESGPNQAIHPQYLTSLISDLASTDAIFTCDVGTPTIWAARYLDMNGKRKLLGSFKHGSMANALPQAIGAQLLYPNKQVITLSGDGGIAMLLGDLLTLKQYNLPIKMIVYNNSAYGFVELEMKASGILEYGTELDNPNFAKMAESLGMLGVRVEHSQNLTESLIKAFDHKGPALVEVMVERNELAMPPHITVGEMAGFSLYMLKTVINGKGNQLIDLIKTNVLI